MRIARKILLLTGLALAATALAASSASGQEEPIEVTEEVHFGGIPCDPCSVHLEGESEIARPDGVVASRCHDELHLRIYHDGNGEMEWEGSGEGAPGCNSFNCAPPEDHWPVYDFGETGFGDLHVYVDFCHNGNHCPGAELTFTEPETHMYESSTIVDCPHPILPFIEFEGHWETEHDLAEDQEVEIEHDDD